MIHAIDVLRVLDVFEATIDRKNIPDDAKKAIALELLASVPHEIMAPGCKSTSDAVRSIIRDYIGIKHDRSSPEKAEEARSGTKESPAEGNEDRTAGSPPNHKEVAGAGDRNRLKKRSR